MKKSARERIIEASSFTQFFTDHINATAGHTLVSMAPISSPLPSALVLLFVVSIGLYNALYKEIQSSLFSAVLAIMIGLVITFVVEGLGFAAVSTRDRYLTYCSEHKIAPTKSEMRKYTLPTTVYFFVTFFAIAGLKTIPTWFDWYYLANETTVAECLFATALLAFPIYSYVGATIYSLSDDLERKIGDAKEKAEDVIGSMKNKIGQLEEVIENLRSETNGYKETATDMSGKIALLKQQKSQALAQIQDAVLLEEELKECQTLTKTLEKTLADLEKENLVLKTKLELGDTRVSQGFDKAIRPNIPKVSAKQRRPKVLKILANTNTKLDFNAAEIARSFNTSDQTIRNDLEWLINNGHWQNGDQWTITDQGKSLLGQ